MINEKRLKQMREKLKEHVTSSQVNKTDQRNVKKHETIKTENNTHNKNKIVKYCYKKNKEILTNEERERKREHKSYKALFKSKEKKRVLLRKKESFKVISQLKNKRILFYSLTLC